MSGNSTLVRHHFLTLRIKSGRAGERVLVMTRSFLTAYLTDSIKRGVLLWPGDR
jgi:hypothetical protein